MWAMAKLGGKWDEPQGAGETPNLEDQMSGQMAVDLEAMRDENLRLLQVRHTSLCCCDAAVLKPEKASTETTNSF